MTPNPEASTTSSASETEARFPEAAAFARAMRDVFGPETRLIYARNQAGEVIGKSVFTDTKLAELPSK